MNAYSADEMYISNAEFSLHGKHFIYSEK